jgi:hypothetical protein
VFQIILLSHSFLAVLFVEYQLYWQISISKRLTQKITTYAVSLCKGLSCCAPVTAEDRSEALFGPGVKRPLTHLLVDYSLCVKTFVVS